MEERMEPEMMQAVMQSLMSQVSALEAKIQRKDAQISSANQEVHNALARCTEAEDAREKVQMAVVRITGEHDHEKKSWQSQLHALQQKHSQLENEKKESEDAFNVWLHGKDTMLKRERHANGELQSTIADLQTKNETLDAAVQALKRILKEKNVKEVGAKKQLEDITAQLTSSRRAEAEAQSTVARLKQAHAQQVLQWDHKLTQQSREMKEENDSLRVLLQSTEMELERLRTVEANKPVTADDVALCGVIATTTKLNEITAQLTASRHAVAQAQTEITQLKQTHAQELQKWKRKLQKLQTKVMTQVTAMPQVKAVLVTDTSSQNNATTPASALPQAKAVLVTDTSSPPAIPGPFSRNARHLNSGKERLGFGATLTQIASAHSSSQWSNSVATDRPPAFLAEIMIARTEKARQLSATPSGWQCSLREWQTFVETAVGAGRVGQLSAVGAATEHSVGLQVQPMNISPCLGTRRGVNSVIFRVAHDNGKQFILKGMLPIFENDAAWGDWIETHLKEEFTIPARHMTPHPNIVPMLHSFVASSRIVNPWVPSAFGANAIRDRTLYIVMPHYPVTLQRLLPGHGPHYRVSGRLVGVVLLQLLLGVDHMAQSEVSHRDLKEDNVCVTADGQLVIIDFGCAIRTPASVSLTSKEQLAQGVGAPLYMPPEIQRWVKGTVPLGHSGVGKLSKTPKPITLKKAYLKAEVFAAGVIAMRTFLGPHARAWTASAHIEPFSDAVVPAAHNSVAPPLTKLITCLVRSDPITRYSAAESISALEMFLFGPPPSTWRDILADTHGARRLQEFVTAEAMKWLSAAPGETDGRDALLGPMASLQVPMPSHSDPTHPGVINFQQTYRRLRLTWLKQQICTPGGCDGVKLMKQLDQANLLLNK